jgi:hypothetical protein
MSFLNEFRSNSLHRLSNKLSTNQTNLNNNRKSINRAELLANLVFLYSKQQQSSNKKSLRKKIEEAAVSPRTFSRASDTPLEQTNINVYYYYYQDSPSSSIFSNKSANDLKSKSQLNFLYSTSQIDMASSLTSMAHFEATKPRAIQKRNKKDPKKLTKLSSTIEIEEVTPIAKPEVTKNTKKSNNNSIRDLLDLNCQILDDGKDPKRFILSSAVIKTMPVSQKFHDDARNMVFVPKSKSFYPKTVDNHLKYVI